MDLGIVTNDFQGVCIAVTLNFGPKTYVPKVFDKKLCKFPWRALTPEQQRDMYARYIKEVYYPWVDSIEAHYEFCASGMVHVHMICYIQDTNEKTTVSYWLQRLRALVMQNRYVVQMFKGNGRVIRTSNYIHLCDKGVDEWKAYIRKHDSSALFAPRFFSKV